MINSANNYEISDILKSESDVKYVVPKYQREYVWGRRDWENLFDDIWHNDAGHFLGSIICINRSGDALQTQELELVDGQQRLATISLLYAALYYWLKTQPDPDEELQHELYNLQLRLVLKSDRSSLKVEPSYQGQNFQDYYAILAKAGIITDAPTPRYAGNRRIFKAYYYFLDRLQSTRADGLPAFDVPAARSLVSKLNGACVVKIEVSSHSDAFTLFESLNNRGVPLSALDLIKNKLLAVLESQRRGTIDENFERWNRLLQNLSEDYTLQERYLRHYYNAFLYEDRTRVEGITLATKSNIIKVYETLIDRNASLLFDNLYEKSTFYSQLVNPDEEQGLSEASCQLRDLDRVGAAPSYILLLHLLASGRANVIPEVSTFLVSYFLRRNLTNTPPTRDMPRLFMSLIERVRSSGACGIPGVVRAFLTEKGRVASDEAFETKLRGSIYEDNVGATRFILCKIEESGQTRETLTDLWERDARGRFIWTVEHIFPQGENIPDNWVRMIADGDTKRAKELQSEHVHKLGNLTITAYNSKLGNMSFVKKRDRTDSRGRAVGYRNGLYLNESLKDMNDWTVEHIVRRTNQLANEAMALFAL